MRKIELNFKSVFILLLILVFLVYWGSWNAFFQQDEWAGLGNFYSQQGLPPLELLKQLYAPMFAQGLGHFLPWTPIANYARYALFELNYPQYMILSLLLHVVASFLVFMLTLRLSKEKQSLTSYKPVAFFAAAFFALASSASQAVTWVGTSLPTQFAVIFSLLAIIFWLDWLEGKKRNKLLVFITAFVLAVGFKEIAVGLFLFLPVYLVIEGSFKKKYIYSGILLSVGAIYVLFRGLMIWAPASSKADTALAIETQPPLVLAYNLATFPIKGVAQTLIPQIGLLDISRSISAWLPESWTGEKETTTYAIFVEQKAIEVLSLLIFILVTVMVFKMRKDPVVGKIAVFAFLFIVLNSFIYALSPARYGVISFIDSRNLYFPFIGTALLLVAIVSKLARFKIIRTVIYLLPFLIFNIFWLERELVPLVQDGTVRKGILMEIKKLRPDLSERAIIYTESDKAFYGLPEEEKILPFQSGLGQTLLVWYQREESFPKEFLENKFLWGITDQGYKEIGNRGFGYFRDFSLLGETVKKYDVPIENVTSFKYEFVNNKITDISQDVVGRLEAYVMDKKLVSPSQMLILASDNDSDVRLAIDSSRETFWSSKIPYYNQQYLLVKLNRPEVVAQIRIDSYNNVDQIAVGYSVLLSDDQKSWREVFRSAKFTPNKEGYVDIYFGPEAARYVKIVQLGQHLSAPWVIHELEFYTPKD